MNYTADQYQSYLAQAQQAQSIGSHHYISSGTATIAVGTNALNTYPFYPLDNSPSEFQWLRNRIKEILWHE